MKEMGDHGEKLVANKLRQARVEVKKMPVNNPGFDLKAKLPNQKKSKRISVKFRGSTNINFQPEDFDWMAIVLIEKPRIFIIPRSIAKKHSVLRRAGYRSISIKKVPAALAKYENNFKLQRRPGKK